MSDKGSVFQKGGGGTNFEQLIQTAFLTTLIIHGNVPGIPSSELIEVAFQVTNRGYETDDLLAVAKSSSGQHRLLIQVKHNISFTPDNETFKEVLKAFWKDFNNTSIFDKTKDKLVVVKSGMTKDERNHLKSLFNWAVNHATETDFVSEVNRINAKKERLDVFRELLKEINNNTALSDKELWEFLKCVDVLEYDFLNESSVDLSYFLNLINLSKNRNSTSNNKDIWDSLFSFAATLNKDGGSATIESIKEKEFFKHFETAKLNPYFKSVDKLKSDSKEILRPIKASMGKDESEFHLTRHEITEKIVESITNFQLTVITGKPGVGKSAQVKEVLQKEFPHANIFVFRADQFNEPTIANVFSSQGVNESIQDIFSCMSLVPEKIIFIDSLEKLLEADPECAFKQLLALLKELPDIKVITASRRYAIDLIALKFGIDKNNFGVVDIPVLDENELGLVSQKFPQLTSVLKNEKIKKLLQSPKYLDFAILAISKTSDDYSNVSITEFKDKLWNSLVVDSGNTKNGLPIKRENAFMEIAVKRAKEMKLFSKPANSDAEAIIQLENDEIVFQENQNRRYSPTHDILEDWALVKYVSQKFEEHGTPNGLFDNLGNEPAIRRAFRLWVEDHLDEDSSKINDLIRASIKDQTIERYWADEILVAVLKSENSNLFFETFKTDLLENNAAFLNRCIHLLKTCCKEADINFKSSLFLIPIGSGWPSMLNFIGEHLVNLDGIKFSICEFLSDWQHKINSKISPTTDQELLVAKKIILHFLTEVENGDESWQKEYIDKIPIRLVNILYGIASISKGEIEELVERAFKYKENRNAWRLGEFYDKVIENLLSGVGNFHLIKNMPELIVKTAWKQWKYVPILTDGSQSRFRSFGHRMRDEECWGIMDKFSFSPSCVYKTPFYNLLFFHPMVGLKFIVEFINYSVDFYVNGDCEHKREISQIEIELNDGSTVKLWAAWELWAAYRGSSVTNYALESLLMGLERFLLETAERKTNVSKENLKFIFDYILKNTNNVALLSVLCSVAIAHPNEVEEAMLPLLSVQEFYEWDLSRALQESSTLSPMDTDIPFAQDERWKSNQRPHRRKYMRGLRDFILDYQFNVRQLNKEIHQVFDKLKSKADKDDIIWKKTLTEIDARNHKIGEYDDKLGGFPIQPEYDEEVTEFMESTKESYEADSKSMNYSGKLSRAYDKKEGLEFSDWNSCYEQYSSSNTLNLLYDRPVTLAILGLRDFSSNIDDTQKEWCIKTITDTIVTILQDTFSHGYGLNRSFNLMEKEMALSSFHLLLRICEDEDDKNSLMALMLYTLIAPFAHHEIDRTIRYMRSVFFEQYPNEAKKAWIGLIKYSIFRKANPYFYDDHDSDRLNASRQKEEEFIQEISSSKDLTIDLAEISFEKCEGHLVALALAITPYNSNDKDFDSFIPHILPYILADLLKEQNYSYNRVDDARVLHHESISDIEQYLADLLLNAGQDFAKSILTLLVNSVLNSSIKNHRGKDVNEFVGTILEYVALKLYDNGNIQPEPISYPNQLANFWRLWEVLLKLIEDKNSPLLTQKLLLNIRYLLANFNGNPNEHSWKALNGKKEFYKNIIEKKGLDHTSSILSVFSTIGNDEFLPEGINWLVNLYKEKPSEIILLISPAAERMIKRLFYNHISKIKSNKILIDDYIWLLNKMVDLGSSEAYLFRENVITYKSVA